MTQAANTHPRAPLYRACVTTALQATGSGSDHGDHRFVAAHAQTGLTQASL